MPVKDIRNLRSGMLTAIERANDTSGDGRARWHCRCDCGQTVVVLSASIVSGHSKSCGCQEGYRSHEMRNTSEYAAWANMRQRCQNPNNPMYENYGGRGITVNSEWDLSFEAFLKDMGPKPSPDLSIERKDVDGNYEVGNCTWGTTADQSNNKRNSVRHSVDGMDLTEKQIQEQYGVSPQVLRHRISRGLTVEEAAKTPVRKWTRDSK